MTLLAWVGAFFCVGGFVASFAVQRRIEAELARHDEAVEVAYGRAAHVGLAGILLGLVAFFLLPAGPTSLASMVFFLGGPIVVYVLRRRVSPGPLARLALLAMAASLALMGGAAAFLLGGGRVPVFG